MLSIDHPNPCDSGKLDSALVALVDVGVKRLWFMETRVLTAPMIGYASGLGRA